MQVVLPDPKGQKDRALRFLPTVASPDSTVAKENAALLALLHVRWCLCVNGFWFGLGLGWPMAAGVVPQTFNSSKSRTRTHVYTHS